MNQNKITKIINNGVLDKLFNYLQDNTVKKSFIYINNLCINYNIENDKLFKKLLSFVIENKTIKNGNLNDFLNEMEVILHNNNTINSNVIVNYTVTLLKKFY